MSSAMTLKIGAVLKALMKEQNLSVRDLARKASIPASTLSEWVNNRAPKNPIQAQQVAVALGVSLHFLLFGQEDGQEPIQKLIKEDFFQGTFEITVKRVKL